MDSIGTRDANAQFPQLPERVAAGERITITRHGVPVAVLGPVPTTRDTRSVGSAIDEILSLQ